MNKLKSFFERKKLDNKFKHVGSGHTLSESRSQDAGSSRAQLPTQRQIPSSGASRAGEAALARLQQQHGQPKKTILEYCNMETQIRSGKNEAGNACIR